MFEIVPKKWRDNLYQLIAKNRHRLFGRQLTYRGGARSLRKKDFS
ncbi:MAG: hypothetical protein J7L95_07455 [Prolixibacteraceae bacterium]|nr:hypothetical protein [Prolixibacteraceae bacterium]